MCLNSTLAVRLMDGAEWVHQTLRFSSNLVRRPAPLRRTIVVSLSLGRAFAVPHGERCPLPALIFHTALSIPRSQSSHCVPLCCSSGVLHSTTCGIDPLSLLLSCPSLVSDSRATLPLLLVLPPFAWTLASAGSHQIVCGRSCSSFYARFWLGRWAYDPFPGGRAARHPGLPLSYTLGEASSGYFFSCLLECLALSTVVSCVLPNSTLHSARLIPRPYLVCWAGLRAFCLAVTISSRFPSSLFPRQEGEDCRNFFGRTPSLQRTGRVVTPPNARTTNSAKSTASVAAVDAATAVGVAAVEETETMPMGMRVAFCETPFCVFVFQSSAYRPSVGFLNVPPSKQRATRPRRNPTQPDRAHCLFSPACLFLRCAVCVVQHPSLLDGPVQMLLGFVHGLFGISVRNSIWCKSVTRSSPRNFLL